MKKTSKIKVQHYDIRVRVYNETPAFGKGIVELLDLVEQYGTLSKSYQEMNMSASKAWKIINRAQKDLGVKLIETVSGGINGGSSFLTPEGKEYLKRYHLMMDEVNMDLKKAFYKYFGDSDE